MTAKSNIQLADEWKQTFDSCLLKVMFCCGANFKGGRSLLATLRIDLIAVLS